MKLLVVCPDYMSHLVPMLQVASEWRRRRGEVVVATGETNRPLVQGFIGSLARVEALGDTRPPPGRGPRVTVALGSFLSARDDVLASAVDAARSGGWRLALAHGSSDPATLGPAPGGAAAAVEAIAGT